MRSLSLVSSLCAGASVLLLAGASSAQQDTKPVLPEKAAERLSYYVGEWETKTDFLTEEGSVERSVKGRDTARYIISGRVVEVTTDVPDLEVFNKAWLFYSFSEQKFYFTSVDADGELWIFSGGLDDYIITSQPKKRADGRERQLRFRHEQIDEYTFEKTMEASTDSGKTWRQVFRQRLKRSNP